MSNVEPTCGKQKKTIDAVFKGTVIPIHSCPASLPLQQPLPLLPSLGAVEPLCGLAFVGGNLLQHLASTHTPSVA